MQTPQSPDDTVQPYAYARGIPFHALGNLRCLEPANVSHLDEYPIVVTEAGDKSLDRFDIVPWVQYRRPSRLIPKHLQVCALGVCLSDLPGPVAVAHAGGDAPEPSGEGALAPVGQQTPVRLQVSLLTKVLQRRLIAGETAEIPGQRRLMAVNKPDKGLCVACQCRVGV